MKVALFLAVMVTVCSSSAWAQSSPDRIDPAAPQLPTAQGAAPQRGINAMSPPQDRISTALSFGGTYTGQADYGDAGVTAIYRAASELTLYIPAKPDELSFTVGLTEEMSWYDFHNKPAVVNQLDRARVSPGVNWKLDDEWSFFGGVSLEAAGENDASISDSLMYGGFAGARYRVSPTLAFSIGASAQTQLEDDAFILPLIGIDWTFAPDWTLSVRGPGARLTWQVNDEWDLTALTGFENRNYRLDDHQGPRDEAVFRDRRAIAGLQAQWTPAPWLSLRGELGAVVWSEIKLDDKDGDELSKAHGDPTGYAGLSATLRF